MIDLPEARKTIADILERRDSDRSVELWQSDIMHRSDIDIMIDIAVFGKDNIDGTFSLFGLFQ